MRLFRSVASQNAQKSAPRPEVTDLRTKASTSTAQTTNQANFARWNSHVFQSPPPEVNTRDWMQSVGLIRYEDYLIDPAVQMIRMGLGWDPGVADIDASAALFDEKLTAFDVVWYRKLQSTCGSVVHSGDNLTGAGSGDDEVISVNLSKLPPHVHHVLFAVTIFRGAASFSQVPSAYVRMLNGKEKHKKCEMCRFSLTDMSGEAILMGVLTRKGSYWNFRALGMSASGRTIMQLLREPKNLECVFEIPSFSPEYRRATVSVIMGRELTAKDRSGFARALSSSDPYYVVKFKDRKYKSEVKAKTLDPEWNSPPFDVGLITEPEPKLLKIAVFDHDYLGSDDFMGIVMIPGYALFNLGPGQHMYWFALSASDKKQYRDEAVSGEILLNIKIEA